MIDLLPCEIVAALDRHIVGQNKAKRTVAIALRNRWRRGKLSGPLREEVLPKNILMIGPTGVGKTEIARRLAKLASAPFLKVEATKFTEVGYVGRDIEQIIRDLVEIAIVLVRENKRPRVRAEAERIAEEKLLDALVGSEAREGTREHFREKLRNKELDETEISIEVENASPPFFKHLDCPNEQVAMLNLTDMFSKMCSGQTKTRRVKVKEGYETLIVQESDKIIDREQVTREAVALTEREGIVFLDEIDKVCHRTERADTHVSREGVQRDLLPLLEGTTVPTKYGPVKSDYILFIASGAFHISKPSDLLPELQGRLPVRIECDPLSREDFVRVLTEPEASLVKQYEALFETEGVSLSFTDEAIGEIARLAEEFNMKVENIGARRLQTILECVLDEISFTAPALRGKRIVLNADDVCAAMDEFTGKSDLSRFIL